MAVKRKQRPITKRIITCIKQSSWVSTTDGETAYLGATSFELCYKLHIKPSQLYRAVSALCKQGKLMRMCRGLYNINQTPRQWEIRQAFFDSCQQELDVVATANEIDSLLKLKLKRQALDRA